MDLRPQSSAAMRHALRDLNRQAEIKLVLFGVFIGFGMGLMVSPRLGPAWVVLTPVFCGLVGVCLVARFRRAPAKPPPPYFIVVEGETVRVKCSAFGGVREVRFYFSELLELRVGNPPRPLLMSFASRRPVIQQVDQFALTFIERGGATQTFFWALAIFSARDLNAFFAVARSRGVLAPTLPEAAGGSPGPPGA